MIIGDVGEDTSEEVNLGAKGANYGWPTCEGSCNKPGMTNPIYAYDHNGRDASITGGFVYRGTQSGLVTRGATSSATTRRTGSSGSPSTRAAA